MLVDARAECVREIVFVREHRRLTTGVNEHQAATLGSLGSLQQPGHRLAGVDRVEDQIVTFRVPYPLGSFYAKGLDGRIDDPGAGWKGRGVWTTSGSRAPFHAEGGEGSVAPVFKFQVRPDPLAH